MPNTNTLTYACDALLAQGLMALRQNCVMPRLINKNYDGMAAEKGTTINVPIPSAVSVGNVTPSYVAPDDAGVTPTSVSITMSNWKEAPFFLTDKEVLEAIEGITPMQASEAIKALANTIDAAILGLYTSVYGWAGTAGTTPFGSDVSEITAARKVLNNQLAPMDDRRVVINADAEANALGLRAFQDMSFSGSAEGLNEGRINRKLGFDWYMDQNVPTHTLGAAGTCLVDGASQTGTTLHVDGLTTKPSAGDVFTIAGDTQTYTVISATDLAGTDSDLTIKPAIVTAPTNDSAITFKASHAVNLAFHRDAFAFVSRPLTDNTDGLGNIITSSVDPVSGLALRLEISRQHKRTRYSYDILYGLACIRPELACRIAG